MKGFSFTPCLSIGLCSCKWATKFNECPRLGKYIGQTQYSTFFQFIHIFKGWIFIPVFM
jgi:hypothetical protein